VHGSKKRNGVFLATRFENIQGREGIEMKRGPGCEGQKVDMNKSKKPGCFLHNESARRGKKNQAGSGEEKSGKAIGKRKRGGKMDRVERGRKAGQARGKKMGEFKGTMGVSEAQKKIPNKEPGQFETPVRTGGKKNGPSARVSTQEEHVTMSLHLTSCWSYPSNKGIRRKV